MKLPLVFHPAYSPAFDSSHRFPMEKFQLLHDYLDDIGLIKQCDMFEPTPADNLQVGMAHDPNYINAYRENTLSEKAMRRIGLPWSEGVKNRTFLAVGGSILTTELALERGLAAHLAGGTHHAHYDEGSGFCIFNDLAICAKLALTKPDIHRVLILDVDVHQGDGTARIFQNQPDVVTVSVHCKQNFPARKAQSDFDIEIQHTAGDDEYLATLKQHVPYLLDVMRPDFVIYDAGADTHENDALGLLNLTSEGHFERDSFVISECVERGIPVSCVIGGGYQKDRRKLAEVHGIVHRAALNVWQSHFA